MSLPRSRELAAIYNQARDIAHKADRSLTTAHLLLALFTVPNRAAAFLEDRNITVDDLLAALEAMGPEADEVFERVRSRSQRIASGSGAEAIDSLHLLAALVRESRSHAYTLLDDVGGNVSAIRASVMSYATGSRSLPRRFTGLESAAPVAEAPAPAAARDASTEHAPSPIGFHPSLGIELRQPATGSGSTGVQTVEDDLCERDSGRDGNRQTRTARKDDSSRARQPSAPTTVGEEPSSPMEVRSTQEESSEEVRQRQDEALDEARRTARRLAESLFKKRREKLERDESQEAAAEASAPDAPIPATEEPTSLGADEASEPIVVDADQMAAAADDARRAVDAGRNTVPPAPTKLARTAEPERPALKSNPRLARSYELDPDEYPNLTKFGRNLTVEAALGKIDRVLGRDAETTQLIDILGKRRSNNPILVGEAGVGKTAIVEGLAREFVRMAEQGSRLGMRAIVELEVGRVIGGTHLRGSFSERLIGLKEEVKRAGGDVIVFLDEIHTWMSAGQGGDGTDASQELKTALARGEFPCIGATTSEEFRKFVEADPAFERRFQVVLVDEPDLDTTYGILDGIRGHYEQHHRVRFTDDALDAAVRLSHRFIHERRLPDKAVGVLDLAGSRAARVGQESVDRADVAGIVAELAGIPANRLTHDDRERFLQMEGHLEEGIIGHRHVIESVCEVIRRNYAGFRSNRPIGSLLFLGPTGVGKTELVKVLADFLFHDRDALVRLDMSEFMESHSVSRLIGSPPGYVGYEQGGQLTEAVRRRPYQVVLLDEIEKAHPDVLNVLLQLLDEGRLTDGRARTVDFSNTVVVLTSNLGSAVFDQRAASSGRRGRIGFADTAPGDAGHDPKLAERVLDAARGHFPPELWNRIDERLVFQPLTRHEVGRIAALQLADTTRRLKEESGIGMVFSDAVVGYLAEHGGFDPSLGARPMRQTIERLIEGAVAKLILRGEASRGDTVYVDADHESDTLRIYAEG